MMKTRGGLKGDMGTVIDCLVYLSSLTAIRELIGVAKTRGASHVRGFHGGTSCQAPILLPLRLALRFSIVH